MPETTKALLPAPFLFRFEIPVRRCDDVAKSERAGLALPDDCAIPCFGESERKEPFGEIRLAWNRRGFAVACRVKGRTLPLVATGGSAASPKQDADDRLDLWIDTRGTQDVHRAGRFCHAFRLRPTVPEAAADRPAVEQLVLARAKENAPVAPPGTVRVRSTVDASGWHLEAWFPNEALHGFDPEHCPRIGFAYHLHDAELGDQFLTVGHDFPIAWDPSLWSTLVLR